MKDWKQHICYYSSCLLWVVFGLVSPYMVSYLVVVLCSLLWRFVIIIMVYYTRLTQANCLFFITQTNMIVIEMFHEWPLREEDHAHFRKLISLPPPSCSWHVQRYKGLLSRFPLYIGSRMRVVGGAGPSFTPLLLSLRWPQIWLWSVSWLGVVY